MSSEHKTSACPDCGGKGSVAAFVARESGHHFDPAMRCLRCKGEGKISAQAAEWIARGRACMDRRRARDESLIEMARRLGMRPSEASAMEHGRADPAPLERAWA